MKEIGAIFVVSISEIRTVQLAAIKRRYRADNAIHRIYRYSADKCQQNVLRYPTDRDLWIYPPFEQPEK